MRSGRFRLRLAAAIGLGLLLCAIVAPASAIGASPPFEPIAIHRINLPASIKEASTPVFTLDGQHLLFFSGLNLWIVGTGGSEPHCLSCGLANRPTLSATEQEGFATEFPDRKRVFFGAAGSVAVLECAPSVAHCASRRILPVDLSGARPGGAVVPPGGADLEPADNQENASSPKLAPDGEHIAFSDIRTDAVELMTIARLTRTATKYVTSDPHTINPSGPTSPTDPNTQAWSDSSALFEFKSFADGGADATYVQVGGEAADNPDLWQVNLRTGKRTRLTANADWDEDDAPSPDGRSIVIESDRNMHRVDMLGGLLPVRGFIDAPEIGVAANYYVAGAVDRQCDLQPWLFPADGDRGNSIMGQPIQPYTGGTVHAANNVSGYPQWSPNGTEIALNTESYVTNRSAPYLLVARLLARRPSNPLPVVSSEPGNWAPNPSRYHGAIGSSTRIVLHGLASGTATVSYANPGGIVSGEDSVTYDHYSDNGRDFVSGTHTISNPNILTGPFVIRSHLQMTGADSGYTNIDLRFSGIQQAPVTVTGRAVVNYDGTTVSGPPHVPQPCPQALPRPPRMKIAVRLGRRKGHRVILAHVSASVAGARLNEAGTDTRPVLDANVSFGKHRARTGQQGNAILVVPSGVRGIVNLRAVAGGTLVPATTRVRLSRLPCQRPTGRLDGVRLGPLALGMRRAAVGRGRRTSRLAYGFENVCLRGGPGIRVAYPSRRLLGTLSRSERRRFFGRVVIALSANRHYRLRGVRPGATSAAARRRLRLSRAFHIGVNSWFVVPGRFSTGLLKVRRGRVREVGIATRALTRGRAAQRRFLNSFRGS
jgi:hypothetical protein